MLQVVVVESRDRVGGRVCDDLVNGSIIGRGAQLINGCVNNPFALICHQVLNQSIINPLSSIATYFKVESVTRITQFDSV